MVFRVVQFVRISVRHRLIDGFGMAVIWALMLATALATPYEVLATFQKPGTPVVAPLLAHSDGNFYGVASANGAFDLGTVFKITPAGEMTTLHSFSGADGSGPAGAITEGADHLLYGTAASGGTSGFGVAFKINTAGVFTKLADFTGVTGAAPGSVPHGLLAHPDGNFYGVAQAGGTGGLGTVFKMTTAGTITTLVNFTGNTGLRRGSEPIGPLAVSGNHLYGVTRTGGSAAGLGAIFEVDTGGTWRLLGSFTGPNGSRPAGGLLWNTDGALYGTTEFGGTNGFGVLFRMTAAAQPVHTVLWNFSDATGSQPAGSLARDASGTLYGTTANGGASGLGAIYKITTGGIRTLLASFSGEIGTHQGSAMRGGLVIGQDGSFYGVAGSGGPGNLGMAFKITSTGTFSGLSPLSLANGWMPSGAPVPFGGDSLIFPVAAGGTAGGGNLMSVSTNGTVNVLAALGGTLGATPDGAMKAAGSTFYGVTARGGASARGTMFRYSAALGASLAATYTTSAGSLAEGPLAAGADGLHYGISREGGATSRGSIYKISAAGLRTRLVSFTGLAGAAPGAKAHGPLVHAADGNFYGLTEEGGASNTGVVFRLTAAGAYSVVSAFGITGPRSPKGGFVIGTNGLLFATTSLGGASDMGTLIAFSPDTGTWEVVGEFTGSAGNSSGEMPAGELLASSDGAIYGSTLLGGAADEGVVFRYSPLIGLRKLAEFTGIDGTTPGSAGGSDDAGLIFSGGLAFGPDSLLYGVAPSGGPQGGGVVYRITPPPPISDWKEYHLSDANSPDLGDFDGDGVTNLIEYAFLTSPDIADAENAPTASITNFNDESRLTIQVPRDPAHSDITVIVEVSETLLSGSWTTLASSTSGAPFSGPGYYAGDSASPGLKLVTIRDIQARSASSQRFIRLRVLH